MTWDIWTKNGTRKAGSETKRLNCFTGKDTQEFGSKLYTEHIEDKADTQDEYLARGTHRERQWSTRGDTRTPAEALDTTQPGGICRMAETYLWQVIRRDTAASRYNGNQRTRCNNASYETSRSKQRRNERAANLCLFVCLSLAVVCRYYGNIGASDTQR